MILCIHLTGYIYVVWIKRSAGAMSISYRFPGPTGHCRVSIFKAICSFAVRFPCCASLNSHFRGNSDCNGYSCHDVLKQFGNTHHICSVKILAHDNALSPLSRDASTEDGIRMDWIRHQLSAESFAIILV
ncbi:hypothetical protein P692DRAFT_201483090 [Suillus brevipes Sb2]|nr:hypothetical protein P692DRAFT_201483090 [Suillus brevipes Sb2]